MTALALQIPMRHEIDGEKVVFYSTDPSKGNALREFEKNLVTIVEREIESRLADRLAKLEEAVAEIRHLVTRPTPATVFVREYAFDCEWDPDDDDEWDDWFGPEDDDFWEDDDE